MALQISLWLRDKDKELQRSLKLNINKEESLSTKK